jgi:hypothetical protein
LACSFYKAFLILQKERYTTPMLLFIEHLIAELLMKNKLSKLTIPTHQDTEIFVVNNAGVFALYSMLQQIKTSTSKMFLFIYPGYWLDLVHSAYQDNQWGQTPLGLPVHARYIFYRLFPSHDETEFLKWHQIKKLRQELIYLICQHPNVLYFSGEPSFSMLADGTYHIDIAAHTPVQITAIKKPVLYTWLREPRRNNLSLGIPTSIVNLYQMPPEQHPKTVCVLGAGLSVVWALRDFHANIVSFHLPNDLIIEIPANAGIDTTRLKRVLIDTTKMALIPNSTHTIRYLNDNGTIEFTCPFYDAIGHQFVTYSGASLFGAGLHGSALRSCDWVAPKNLPIGSLTFSYAHIAHEMREFRTWLGAPSYYCQNYFIPAFRETAAAHGIYLSDHFFSHLRNLIMLEENALSPEVNLLLFERAFNRSSPNTSYRHFSEFLRPRLMSTHYHAHPVEMTSLEKMTFPTPLMDDLIALRLFFETHLAYLLSQASFLMPATCKLARIAAETMEHHHDLLIHLIEKNPSFQLTIYSEEKFSSFHPPLDYCRDPEKLFKEFVNTLNTSKDLMKVVHLICMFAFRIYPHLIESVSQGSQFSKFLDRFNLNTTFRNEKMRLNLPTSNLPLKKTFFGLTNKTDIPMVPPHTYTGGFFYTEDQHYANTIKLLDIGFLTGPSGHTSRILSFAASYHFSPTEIEQLALAAFAYLAGGGNHNFHEVFVVAESFGVQYEPGTYSVLPETIVNSTDYQMVLNKLKIELNRILVKYPNYQKPILKRIGPYYGLQQHFHGDELETNSQAIRYQENECVLAQFPVHFSKSFFLSFIVSYSQTALKINKMPNRVIELNVITLNTLMLYFLYGPETLLIYLLTKIFSYKNVAGEQYLQPIVLTVATMLSLFLSNDPAMTLTLSVINTLLSCVGSFTGKTSGEYVAMRFFSPQIDPIKKDRGLAPYNAPYFSDHQNLKI